MSYQTWTISGYGICVTDIPEEKVTLEKFKELCNLAAKSGTDAMHDFMEDHEYQYRSQIISHEIPTDEDATSYLFWEDSDDPRTLTNFAMILCEIIKEAENVDVIPAMDYNDQEYILITPHYSWESISDRERDLTIKDAKSIFEKYLKILDAEEAVIDYYDVENGG